jgi:hypothetical protein
MRRTGKLATVALVGALAAPLLTPATARSQVAWDGPMLMAPGAPAGWGFHLVDPHPGDGLGGLVTWRSNPAPVGLGFRAGLFEGVRDDLGLVGGVDVSGTIHRGTGEVPTDVIWFVGAGAGIDDDLLLSFPAGIALGWSFQGDNVAFRPYVAPRLVLDAFVGDDREDDLDLGVAVEIGLDLAFDPDWAIRTAGSFGDRDAVSVGIVLTPGR